MCFCLRCTPAGPTTTICGCAIDQSKTLYYTLPSGGAKPAWLSPGTYALTYSAAGVVCSAGNPFFPWGEGWYYEDASMVIAFHKSCGIASCSKGFGSSVGNGSGVVSSCSPLLVTFGGAVMSGTVHE